MIEWGFRLPWEDTPAPLRSTPPSFKLPSSQEACQVLEQEISAMLMKEAIEEISSQAVSPGFYGRLFCVPKASGGHRPVLDLSPLNVFLRKIHFRMETVSSVRSAIRPGDWATQIDLKDAYFHVLIHRRFRKWLRFIWKDRIFQFRALPFGLSLAPWVFTRIVREVCIAAHSKGIRLVVYLDDWMTLAANQSRSNEHSMAVVSLARTLGFILNGKKCSLTPSQTFTYLGMRFDTVSMLVRPTPERIERFVSLRDQLLSRQHTTARSLAALLGQIESLAPLVPLGHVHKRELQRQFRSRWRQARQPWDAVVPLKGWFQQAIAQWMQIEWLQQGVPIAFPVAQVDLYTDASMIGWGAHVADLTASGIWPQEMTKRHINFLEMVAVSNAVRAFLKFLTGKSVLLCTDNTTVACYVNRGGGVTLSNSFARGGVPSSTLPEQQHCSQSKTCGRKNQHSRRLSESARDDSSDRMDACPFRASTSLGALAQTHDRFVCDPIQQQTTDICVPGTRSEGSGNGRSVHQLGGDVRIRVPTLPYSEQGYQEGQDRQSLPHSDCTNVASTTLVSGAPRACSSTSTQTERRKKRPPAAKIWHTAPKPGQAVPSRLAGVRKRLRALGASRQLCDLVSKSHRSGTNAVYSSHWKRWLSFCSKQGISPSSPSELDLGNFLAHLSQDCGLSASSLRVYRAAVSTTLRQLGSLTFSDSSLLRDVIRGASNRDARAPRRLPAWDLFLVLASLREAPYEPLFSSDLKSLTCKTVFLIALASGRRASEVCNLSGLIKDIATQQDGSFILKFLPEFLAKNQDPSDPSPCIVIRPLTDFCPDDPDLKLCPVRSLKRYLKFTRSLRKSQRKLFISFNPFHSRDISTASISRWLKLVIKSAYTSASLDINSVRAHEIRAWAASTAFAHSWSMRDVLGAAYWRSESPFISFYLRDVSLRREDGTHGISFVAAQQVISCRRH